MKPPAKPIWLYLLLAFLPVWAVCFALLLWGPADVTLQALLFAGFMFMPAIASILTRLLCREGFTDIRLKMRVRGNIGALLLAWFLPMLLTAAGAALYFLLEPGMFALPDGVPAGTLIATAAVMLAGPALNFIPAFGEELGWRGYLLPKLALRMPPWAAGLVSGAVWGLWHAPMIALGHNYGFGYVGYPWTGVALMTLFCVLFGLFLTWLTERTGSAIPAALAHGGLNAVAGLGAMFCRPGYDPLVGPFPMGLAAGIPVLLFGLMFLLLLIKKNRPRR